MSDESTRIHVDIERLEGQIENLRWAVIILFIIVSILSIYVIFQLIPQSVSLLLSAFVIIFLLALILLFNECGKNNGAPAGT